jgi:hypothetical protein
MDSGAGQTMIALGATVVPGTVQSCSIDVEGIGGDLRIRQIAIFSQAGSHPSHSQQPADSRGTFPPFIVSDPNATWSEGVTQERESLH